MNRTTQAEKAESFRAMHDRQHILVLPNAWDAASARIFEAAGFSAIATTSAGLSHTAGYADGERIPRADMLTLVRWIASSVNVPVSADIESGFGEDDAALTATISAIIEVGAVGINLEDSRKTAQRELYSLDEAVARIRVARAAASRAGVPLVINARTDVFLLGVGDKSRRVDLAIERLNAYRRAGADCLYPIGYLDHDTIARLAREIDGPINVMGAPGVPSVSDLERLGVARVSTASGPARVAMTATMKLAEQLRRDGSFAVFGGDVMTPQAANALMARAPR